MTQSVPAFKDTVDSKHGLCGEKVVELTTTPAFVSITLGVDPINTPFTINYDGSKAFETETKIPYKVYFKVTFKEYEFIPTYTSSFSFEIQCPKLVHTSSIIEATKETVFYDVANPRLLKVPVPTILHDPYIQVPGVGCFFEVIGFEIYYRVLYDEKKASENRLFDQPLELTYSQAVALQFVLPDENTQPTSLNPDDFDFEFLTNNRTFVGLHEFTVKYMMSSGEKLQPHDFNLTMYDSCNQSAVITTQEIEDMDIKSLSPESQAITQTLNIFTDKVSQKYGSEVCFDMTYKILDEKQSPGPDWISVEYIVGEPTFNVILATNNYDKAGIFELLLRAELKNYPGARAKDLKFTVEILDSDVEPFVQPVKEEAEDEEVAT